MIGEPLLYSNAEARALSYENGMNGNFSCNAVYAQALQNILTSLLNGYKSRLIHRLLCRASRDAYSDQPLAFSRIHMKENSHESPGKDLFNLC